MSGDPEVTRLDQIRDECIAFHRKHPEVWRMFEHYAHELIARGFKHYSANAIFERIRWRYDVAGEDGQSTFKLNNNFRALYARRFMAKYPKHAGFFRTREQTSAHDDPGARPLGPADFPTYPNEQRAIAP